MITLFLHLDDSDSAKAVCLVLPASRWDIVDALAKLGAPSLDDCFITYMTFPVLPEAGELLSVPMRNPGYFDELNYFAQRASELSAADQTLLNGALAIHQPTDLKTMINLTWHLDSIVMGDADSDEKLGRFLVENGHIEVPEDMVEYLDYTKIGIRYRTNNTCAFSGNNYFEDTNPTIEAHYDGVMLPEMPQWAFRVKVYHKNIPPTEASVLPLELPAKPDAYEAVFTALGAKTADDLYIYGSESRIGAVQWLDKPRLTEMDYYAAVFAHMSDSAFIKFLAVAEHEGWKQLSEMAPHLHELKDYDFIPKARVIEAKGSYGVLLKPDPEQTLIQDCQMEHQMGGMA